MNNIHSRDTILIFVLSSEIISYGGTWKELLVILGIIIITMALNIIKERE